MRLRILTWNIRRQAHAWHFLDDVLKPDVALLQEAVTPKGRANVVYREGGIGDRRRWGSAVATRAFPLVAIDRATNKYTGGVKLDLHRTHPGSVAVAELALPHIAPITAVSVYGLIEHGYANTTVHRIISDLTPLFDSRARKRLVLGGDLNVSTQLDPPYDTRSRLIFERLELFGLVDLLKLTANDREPLEGCTLHRFRLHARADAPPQAGTEAVPERLPLREPRAGRAPGGVPCVGFQLIPTRGP